MGGIGLNELIGLLMIFGPPLLGGVVGWRWVRSWSGVVAAIVLGLAMTAAGLAAFLLTTPSSAEEACGEDECVQYFGRWLEATLARQWPAYTAIAWSVAVVGAFMRRRSRRFVGA